MGLFGYISSMPELNGYNIGCMAQEDENIYRKCSPLLIQNTPFLGKLRPIGGKKCAHVLSTQSCFVPEPLLTQSLACCDDLEGYNGREAREARGRGHI